MSAPASPAITSGLVILAILVLFMARRTVALYYGSPYSPTRVFGYGAFQTFLFLFFAASTIYVALGTWGYVGFALVVPYALVVVGAAMAIEPRVRAHVKFETRSDGRVYYRLPIVIPLLTLILFIVRVSVEILLFGLAALFSFSFPTSLPVSALILLIAVDLLYGASIGFVYGRGLAVRAAFLARGPPAEAARPLS